MTHPIEYVRGVMLRDLAALRRELAAYADERDLWTVPPGTENSAGTLALHLAGNLQHFVGAVLGGTGYVRNREAEFSRRDVPRADLYREIDAASAAVDHALGSLAPEAAAAEFPESAGRQRVNTTDLLIHLATHLTYHLGQVDYHRRIVTGDGSTVNAVAITGLRSAHPA